MESFMVEEHNICNVSNNMEYKKFQKSFVNITTCVYLRRN